jgi:hypothetical protein
MTRKWFVHVFLTASLTVPLAACSESGDEDPYKLVTLKEACYGQVVSKNFKYKFVNPEIVALNRNLGLIREGNEIEFIAARSLADRLEGHTDGALELAVVKKFSPYVHFKVERIVVEGDTMFPTQAGGIAYPTITTAEAYGIDAFEDRDLDKIPYNNTGVLRPLVGKKIKVSGKIVTEKTEGKIVYFVEGRGAKLRIGDTTDGIGLIIKTLEKNNYTFEGGLMMTEVEPFAERRQNRVAGTFEVQYVMYGDQLISG